MSTKERGKKTEKLSPIAVDNTSRYAVNVATEDIVGEDKNC